MVQLLRQMVPKPTPSPPRVIIFFKKKEFISYFVMFFLRKEIQIVT
jgi:hypothetical protein